MYRPGDFITKGFPVPDSVKQNGNQLDPWQRWNTQDMSQYWKTRACHDAGLILTLKALKINPIVSEANVIS